MSKSQDAMPGSHQQVVKWRWRIWRDAAEPENRFMTKETFDDWKDAAERCQQLNARDAGKNHWCRIIEAAT